MVIITFCSGAICQSVAEVCKVANVTFLETARHRFINSLIFSQYGDHIYWTDWYRKSVERADKRTGKDRIVIRTDLDGVMEISAVAAERQTGWTPCAVQNGGCSHLCLYRQQSYVCACPDIPDFRPCSTGNCSTHVSV